MDRWSAVKDTFLQAFARFEEALEILERTPRNSSEYVLVRDALIQRFEFTFETFWKMVKVFLEIREGIVCASPRRCFRELFATGYLSEEETRFLLGMVDLRNLTAHTYSEEVAEEVVMSLPDVGLMLRNILPRLEKEDSL